VSAVVTYLAIWRCGAPTVEPLTFSLIHTHPHRVTASPNFEICDCSRKSFYQKGKIIFLNFVCFSTLKLLPAFSTLDIFGTLAQIPLQQLRDEFGTRIHLNMFPFSNIARPTTGIQCTSIWGLRTRL